MITPVSVTELSRRLKSVVENEFKFVFVTGEISNFKHHNSSGHFYFTLKDDSSQISAIMWKSRNEDLFFTPENGMKVVIKGRITLYESRGCYQIDVFEIKPFGVGELQIAFENLKKKLFDEGLFAEEFKKPIPPYPEKIALITSESGAAIQDFLKVTKSRFPSVRLFLIPVNVQGREAVLKICKALSFANRCKIDFDIIVLMRGGGSIEDLWCFNEESLAREIFKSGIPVVSAIGHEVDFTICDFVSDLRAPTPSAAAEMIFPDKRELVQFLNRTEVYLKNYAKEKIADFKYDIENVMKNYFFNKPKDIISEYKLELDEIQEKLYECSLVKIRNLKNALGNFEKLFNSLNPDKVLKRGFTLIKRDGKIISRKKRLNDHDNVKIKFFDGEADAIITKQFQLKF